MKTGPFASIIRRITGGAFFAALLVAPSLAPAESLDKVLTSPAYRKYRDRPASAEEHLGPKWFDSDSNFRKVYVEKDGPLYALDWLGISATGLAPGAISVQRSWQFLYISREFSSKDLKKVTILILIPHPKYLASKELGLLPKFAELEPPFLKISYSEKIELDGIAATIYEKESGGCSLHIPMARSSVINISAASSAQKKELLALGGKLDLARFNQKLNS